MKFTFASTTIGSLVLSTAPPKSYLLALANSIAEMYNPEKAAWDERSRLLRQKIKAKIELKKKLRTGKAYLATLEEECDPNPMLNAANSNKTLDLGILDCNEGEYCIKDSSSLAGGICAKVVYEDSSAVPARGNTKYEDIGDWMVAGGKQLKMLTVPQELKVQHLLEQNKLDAGRYSSSVGEECNPGKNQGFVDVGVRGCQNSTHYCVEDLSSSLGGTCVHFDWDVYDSLVEKLHGKTFMHCRYTNGKPGLKCWALGACNGMSDDFKRNNIGCGSCNAESACQGIDKNAGSTIGEQSCNKAKSCRQKSVKMRDTHHRNDGVAKRITIEGKSCNGYYSCSYSDRSEVSIGSNSCNSIYTCMHLEGHTTIFEHSCNQDGSFVGLNGTSKIQEYSCNSCYSCTKTSGLTVGNRACEGTQACYRLPSASVISDGSCVGANACTMSMDEVKPYGAYNAGGLTIGKEACLGTQACYRLPSASVISDGSCVGAGACTMSMDEVKPYAAFNVGSGSCLGCYPCSNITGSVSIGNDSCLGFSACKMMSGNVTIGSNSCYGLKACSNSQDLSIIEISDGSCYHMKACMSMSGNTLINSSSCVGTQACQRTDGGDIGLNSCTGTDACLGNKGDIGDNSCNGDWKVCQYNEGLISSNSCLGIFWTCENNKGKGKIGSNSCLGREVCSNNSGSIGLDSCTNFRSCRLNEGDIGSNSCDGRNSCYFNRNTIGNCVCNTKLACERNEGSAMDYDGCVDSTKLANGQSCVTSSECISGLCKRSCLNCNKWYEWPKRYASKCSASLSDNALSTPSLVSLSDNALSNPSLETESCFPNARKVKLHLLNSVIDIRAFEFHVASLGVNVADGEAVSKSLVANQTFEASTEAERDLITSSGLKESLGLEIDLGQSYSVDSVAILGRWCMDSSDPDCLCKLNGAILTLVDDSGEETTSVNIGNDACGKSMLEYVFDAAPEFCVPEVQIPTKQNVRRPWIQRQLKKKPTNC